jgi:hypothetical protein
MRSIWVTELGQEASALVFEIPESYTKNFTSLNATKVWAGFNSSYDRSATPEIMACNVDVTRRIPRGTTC